MAVLARLSATCHYATKIIISEIIAKSESTIDILAYNRAAAAIDKSWRIAYQNMVRMKFKFMACHDSDAFRIAHEDEISLHHGAALKQSFDWLANTSASRGIVHAEGEIAIHFTMRFRGEIGISDKPLPFNTGSKAYYGFLL